MAPDIEELIKRVNTLTLDKNRLKQKLTQLTSNQLNATTLANQTSREYASSISGGNNNNNNSNIGDQLQQQQLHSSPNQTSQGSSSLLQEASILSPTTCTSSSAGGGTTSSNSGSGNNINTARSPGDSVSSYTSSPMLSTAITISNNNKNGANHVIAGIECSSSCEEDLLYMNELYRKRLDEYIENWDYIQSKCSALSSELNALQKHYALLRKEKLQVEEKLKLSCDENDRINSELQTVVLNYETQLSAMSDHLSMITSQVGLADDLARVQSSH